MDCSTAMNPWYCSTTPTIQKVSRFWMAASVASLNVWVDINYPQQAQEEVHKGCQPRIRRSDQEAENPKENRAKMREPLKAANRPINATLK